MRLKKNKFFIILLINVKKIYIHCTSGIIRAPQIAIMYYYLYKNLTLDQAFILIKQNRPISKPNKSKNQYFCNFI